MDWFEALHAEVMAEHDPLIARGVAEDGDVWLFLTQDGPHVRALANYYSFVWRPVWRGSRIGVAALDVAVRDLKRRAATLHLGPLPYHDRSALDLEAALQSAGWIVDTAATSTNHWLDTHGRSFADWWAARPGALRSTVQRKSRKGLVSLEIHTRYSDDLWDDYERVYLASWKVAESHPAFLRNWARRASDDGTLRLGLARIDGAAVAAQFWLVDGGTAYIVKLAHVAGHDALSPGTLLSHAMFERAFEVDRVARIDFGTGDDGYKRDWMEDSERLATIRAWNPLHPAAWPGLARHIAKRVATRLGAR